MVSDTRSASKIRDELGGHGSKQKANVRKELSKRSPGNSGKASASGQQTESPLSVRKSRRLEKETLPVTTPVKRTSERLGTCNTPSPLRRSDRGKKHLSFSSSSSQQSAEEPLSNLKKKKEKTLIQLAMELESNKAELDLEVVGTKRKTMNARKFKALFKKQRIQDIVLDGGNELERSEKIVDNCSDNSRGMKDREDLGDECRKRVAGLRDKSTKKANEGAHQESTSRDDQTAINNAINLDSCHNGYVVDGHCSKYPHAKSSLSDMSDNSEKNPNNCSTENKDDSESSQDGSVSGNFNERCIYPEEDFESPLVYEHCNLEGTCLLCSKSKRVSYDSPELELCSCSAMEEDLVSFATCKGTSDLGAAVTSISVREFDCGHPSIEIQADYHKDGRKKVCSLCSKDGDFLYCKGKSCKRCYHLSCLDPPLTAALPGVWHCPWCVKKKLLFGVHSVSNGVESVWGVREVDVPNAKGIRQRQFLVKYHGLAHVHNHWVPEKQLLLENPCLVSNFLENNQIVEWNAEWMVPHRLLWRRPILDKVFVASTSVISVCEFEWLVKWRGLNYDHATWELDNANFLSSSLGQGLLKDYEFRRGKAKQETNKPYSESNVRHSDIPTSQSHANENYVVENANKLHEFLSKCPNAVVLDDQEQTTTAVCCIHLMIKTCQPFLIVTTSDSLSRWEVDFERLAPSVNLVVYSGSSDSRKWIRASEFYDDGGCMMIQVLLSSVEVVLEDLEILRSIKWKAIVIDEYQHSGIANGVEQIKMLSTDMRILLISGHIKDTTSEYLRIISLVEPHCDFVKLRRSLNAETNDNLSKLKDRLSRFIAYRRSSQVSKFIEYWVPVQISTLQLEHYCAALLSKFNTLCSCSRKDPVGVLREILLTVRKCCDHPYLLDSSEQARLIADMHPAAEILDIGIKASGKLQLLDTMLTEIRARGLRVLILFQLVGSGQLSTGNILDDFLRQRFGLDAYERIDAAYPPSEKQAALNRFNQKKTGQFVFLLENRACTSIVRISSLDVVVIYDSDLNPANDLRALKKISIDSKVEQIKVFRLYSSFTIEERALMLAKKNLNFDSNSQNVSRSTSNLLSWGATYLFCKLDEYHADSNSSLELKLSSGKLLLDEVNKEFRTIISEKFKKSDSNSAISEATLDVGRYITNTLLFGESKVQLKDDEVPHVFWRNLLEGKNPPWKHLSEPSPRNRKRVHHYWEGSPSNLETGKDNMAKKRKKMVNESLGPAPCQVELGAHKVTHVTVSNGGPSVIEACNQSEDFLRDRQSSLGAEVSASVVSKERIVSNDEQQRLNIALHREIKTLCQTLKLPENVHKVAELFLEYVIKNHHVSSYSTSIKQAFQISLCWVAASIAKQKVDKKELLMLARQLLFYQCTEEQASSVYAKMRSLKRMYLQCSDNITLLNRDCLLTEEVLSSGPSNVNDEGLQCSSKEEESSELEIRDESADKEHAELQVLKQQKVALKDKADASEIYDEIKKVEKKCDKKMKKLIAKQQEQIQELLRIWEGKKLQLQIDHRLDSAFIRSIHGQSSAGVDKLKILNEIFEKKIKDHDILKDAQLKNIEAEHLTITNSEKQKAADWLAKAKAFELRVTNGHQSLGSQSGNDADADADADGPQPSTCVDVCGGDQFPMSGLHLKHKIGNKSFCTQGNNVIPKNLSMSAPADAICHELPVENIVSINSQNLAGVESLTVVELLCQSKNSSDNRDADPVNLPASVKQVCDEIHSVSLTENNPVVPGTVSNENAGYDQPGELSFPSEEELDKLRKASLSEDLLSQRGEIEVAASGGLNSSRQPSLHSEQTTVLPNCGDLLPHIESDSRGEENRSGPQIVIAALEPTDSITPVLSNFKSPITDGIVIPEPSNKAPVDEVFGELHPLSVDVSLTCNQSSATPPPTAVPEGAEVVLHESISQNEENLEMHPDCLDVEPASGVGNEQYIELPFVPQSDMAIHQEVVHSPERPSHAVLQNDVALLQEVSEQPNQCVRQVVDIDAGNLHPPGFLVIPSHQPTFWNSAPSLLPDPLQNELERIRKETEQLEKSHADMIAEIKSDCDKKIEEFISQMRNRCDEKCKETDAEFKLKKNELDKNQRKVLLNKILAEAFRSKCLEARASGLPGIQQGIPNFMLPPPARSPSLGLFTSQPTTTLAVQTIPQLSRSQSARSSPVAICNVTAQPVQQPTTTPAVQTIPQLSRSHPVRSSHVAIRNVTAQPVQHAAALVSGSPAARPPVISSITSAQLRAAGEVRSAPPHLQPSCRPIVGSPNTSSPVSQLQPVRVSHQPVHLPSQLPLPDLVTQKSATEVQGGIPAPSHPPGFPQGLVADRQPYFPNNRNSPKPDIPSTSQSLDQSNLEMSGNALGTQTSAAEPDVVCLSDSE